MQIHDPKAKNLNNTKGNNVSVYETKWTIQMNLSLVRQYVQCQGKIRFLFSLFSSKCTSLQTFSSDNYAMWVTCHAWSGCQTNSSRKSCDYSSFKRICVSYWAEELVPLMNCVSSDTDWDETSVISLMVHSYMQTVSCKLFTHIYESIQTRL